LSAASVVGCPMKSSLVEVRQRGEPNLGGLSDPAFTRSRFGISITRFCVRTLASSCEILSGWSFPPSVLFACREYRLTVAHGTSPLHHFHRRNSFALCQRKMAQSSSIASLRPHRFAAK
jgi:hypothetical protein